MLQGSSMSEFHIILFSAIKQGSNTFFLSTILEKVVNTQLIPFTAPKLHFKVKLHQSIS